MRSCRILIILFYVPLKLSNKPEVDTLIDLEVIVRQRKIYSGSDIIQHSLDGETLTKEHHVLISQMVEKWRNRSEDINWFICCLNKYIARKANFEDNCTVIYICCHPWRSPFGLRKLRLSALYDIIAT